MDIDSWLGDEPEAPPADADDCELLEMTPADRDPLANTMSEAKQMIVGSTTMVGCNPQSCRKRPAPGVSMAKDDGGNPAWRCVVMIDNKPNNPRVQCRFCDKVFIGGPSKNSCHMTTGGQVSKCNPHSSRKLEYEICRKAVVAHQEEFQKNKKEVNRQKMENYADTPNVGDLKKYMKGSKESFEVADAAVGDWIFCEGKCLSTCDSDKFRTMLQAVEKAGSSYVPPNRNRLSTELLDKAYDIQVQAEQSQSSGDLSTYGATICSDGWKSITDRSLINVMLSTVSGSWMKMSLDASKKTKGKNFIADLIVKEIMSLPDPRSVIIVAVDGGNRTSLPLIEEQCPWVSGVICMSHSCDLILQDVGDPDHSKVWSPKFDWIQEEVRKWDKMVSYVRNHTKLLDMFRGFSDLELLKHCETRFATKFLSGARLCRVKSRMQQMVTSDKFQTWTDSLKKPEERETAKVFKEQVLDDVGYWYRSLFIIEMYGSVFGLLKACDMDEATLGVVYERMAHAVSTIDELPTDAWFTEQRKEDALDHLEWRWSYPHCSAHSAAFCVNPFFHEETVSNDAELMSNLESCALKMMASEEECLTLMEQFDHWKDAQITGLAKIALEKKRVPPHKWWKQYGSKWPVLQSFACRILAQRFSATACERNWSGYDYIWSKKRNRLDTVRAGKLVYVFMNSKLSCQGLTKWTEMRMMMDLNYEETRKPCSTQSSEDTQYAHDVAEGRVHHLKPTSKCY